MLVDGVAARFQFIPSQHQDNSHEGDLSNGSKSQMEAADKAYRKYALDLYREMQPELLIYPSNPLTPTDTSQEPESALPVEELFVYFAIFSLPLSGQLRFRSIDLREGLMWIFLRIKGLWCLRLGLWLVLHSASLTEANALQRGRGHSVDD